MVRSCVLPLAIQLLTLRGGLAFSKGSVFSIPHHGATRALSSSINRNPLEGMESEPQTMSPLSPQELSNKVFKSDNRPVILFDGVCNMCNGAVNTAIDWDPRGKLRYAALQSNVGRALLQANGREADDISSIVLVTEEGAYIKSDAILRITEALTPFRLLPLKPAAKLGRFLVPRILRDIIYDGVADNRYSIMGTRDECRFDADGELEERFINDSIAG